MALRIENNFITTSYYKQNKKEVVPETTFKNQLNNSQKKFPLVDSTDTASLGLVNNTGGYRISTNDKIEKRREEIHNIQDKYDRFTIQNGPEGKEAGWGKVLNPKLMEDVLNLKIENNKDAYFTNGKIDINKVAKDCDVSLNNATPLELESIRRELKDEGLISEQESDALDQFVRRAWTDIEHENGCSMFDAYKNIKFNVSERANAYKKEDIEYNIDQRIKNLDDMVLDLIK